MNQPSNKVLAIVGPTASGKTKLSVRLAKTFGGEIISADSRQVYQGMTLGTGKDLAEYQFKIKNLKFKISYHLIDVANPKRLVTVAQYQKLAYRAIEDILQRGKLPIICGGTGLYVSAVVEGYQFPKVLSTKYEVLSIRKKLRRLSLSQLLHRLKRVDPITYKVIDKKNRRRVERALEIYYLSGQPKSALLKKKKPPYDFLLIGLNPSRLRLDTAIKRRLNQRLTQGLVAEVRRLHHQGISWKRLDEFGLEYRWVARYLQGKVSRKEMREKLETDIRQFARRQMTWFRRMQDIHWVSGISGAKRLTKRFVDNSG